MKLVLQCAMCGTCHAVGTPHCTACHASGVTQMRLMFECPTCGNLGINPVCDACPLIEPLEIEDDLIIAEEVSDEALSLDDSDSSDDFLDFDLDLDLGEDDLEDEAVIVDLTEEGDPGDSDSDALDFDDDPTED